MLERLISGEAAIEGMRYLNVGLSMYVGVFKNSKKGLKN